MKPCQLIIQQSGPLSGRVRIAGAKNAALKILAATLLTEKPCIISNLPHLHDLTFMLELLTDLGCHLTLLKNDTVSLSATNLSELTIPYELVKKMRASIVVLGPLLAAYGHANVALPGGCAIGSRPVDIHLEGFKAMGAEIELENGFIKARVKGKLKAADIRMHTVTVTGTENLMMAATLADGVTNLYNAACEPEIIDLANFLNKMGAKIEGAGTPHIVIQGVDTLHGTDHQVIADRIEAGTFLMAGAMTHGKITIDGIAPAIIKNTLEVLTQAGAQIQEAGETIHLNMEGKTLRAVSVTTAPVS